MRIRFEKVHHFDGTFTAEMTVTDGTAAEQVSVPISKETAASLKTVLDEEPFRATKPGCYHHELSEIIQEPGIPKTLVVEICKGRSRVKRSIIIGNELFLILWNVLHFQVLPSQLPQERRRS